MVSRLWFAAFIVVTTLSLSTSASEDVFVYRVAQFDRNRVGFGSRVNQVNADVTLAKDIDLSTTKGKAAANGTSTGSLNRQAVIASVEEVSPALLALLNDQSASGLFITLPNKQAVATLSAETAARVASVEQLLLSQSWNFAIFFIHDDADVARLVGDVALWAHSDSPFAGSVRAEFGDRDSGPLSSLRVESREAWMYGAATAAPGKDDLPVVVVTASSDAWAAAPGLATGANRGASGTAALLALMRIYSRLRQETSSSSSSSIGSSGHHIVFLLAGAGAQDHAGIRQWLKSADSRVLSSVSLAVALDALTSPLSSGLAVHVPSSSSPSSAQKVFVDALRASADRMQVTEVHHPVADPSSSEPVDLAHLQFARRKIPSLTVTGAASVPAHSVLDTLDASHPEALAVRVTAVAQALLPLTSLALSPVEVTRFVTGEEARADTAAFLSQTLRTLTKVPRCTSLIAPSSSASTAPLLQHTFPLDRSSSSSPHVNATEAAAALAEVNKLYASTFASLSDATVFSFALDGHGYTLFAGGEVGIAHFYVTRPLTLHVAIAIGVVLYLFLVKLLVSFCFESAVDGYRVAEEEKPKKHGKRD